MSGGLGRRGLQASAVLVGLAWLALSAGCGGRRDLTPEQELLATAVAEYQLVTASPERLGERLGLTAVHQYGRLLGFPTVTKVKGGLLAEITFWCDGLDDQGRLARVHGRLWHVSDGRHGWHVDGPLSFGRQFLTWLGITLFCVFAVFATMLAIVTQAGCGHRAGVSVAWVCLLPTAGFVAADCFGSVQAAWVAVGALLPFYIWLSALLLGARWARRASGAIVAAVVCALCLVAAWFLLSRVVPYVAIGTLNWFDWLFGHFRH